jgi:16S rRNA (guanine966-N2)-methyltransferase
MRIIAGEWKGRTIKAPAGRDVRPTGDRAREAWMSIIHMELPGARVLDLFAGTGALGLEALSRGAASADFVEESARTIRVLNANIDSLGAGSRAAVHQYDALKFIGKLARSEAGAYDIAFADPPWRTDLALAVANLWHERPFAKVLGVEHEAGAVLPAGGDTRRYGDTAVSFYRLRG